MSNISCATCICHATSARVLAKVHRRHLAHYTHHRNGRLIFTHPSMSPTTRVCSRSIPPFHPEHVLVPHACMSKLHWESSIPPSLASSLNTPPLVRRHSYLYRYKPSLVDRIFFKQWGNYIRLSNQTHVEGIIILKPRILKRPHDIFFPRAA